VTVRDNVNVPLVKEVLGLRISAYDSYIPGYIDNAYSGARDVNVLRRYGERRRRHRQGPGVAGTRECQHDPSL
jgi:hypothetical protein